MLNRKGFNKLYRIAYFWEKAEKVKRERGSLSDADRCSYIAAGMQHAILAIGGTEAVIKYNSYKRKRRRRKWHNYQ